MSEHTPGPWKVVDGDSYDGWYEPGEYEYLVITTHPEPRPNNQIASFWDSEFGYEAQANASLIAAAPDMAAEIERLRAENARLLEACKMAREAFEDPDPDIYSQAERACIAAIRAVEDES